MRRHIPAIVALASAMMTTAAPAGDAPLDIRDRLPCNAFCRAWIGLPPEDPAQDAGHAAGQAPATANRDAPAETPNPGPVGKPKRNKQTVTAIRDARPRKRPVSVAGVPHDARMAKTGSVQGRPEPAQASSTARTGIPGAHAPAVVAQPDGKPETQPLPVQASPSAVVTRAEPDPSVPFVDKPGSTTHPTESTLATPNPEDAHSMPAPQAAPPQPTAISAPETMPGTAHPTSANPQDADDAASSSSPAPTDIAAAVALAAAAHFTPWDVATALLFESTEARDGD